LRIFPSPVSEGAKKMWVEFTVETDPWTEEAGKEAGAAGINNMNTFRLKIYHMIELTQLESSGLEDLPSFIKRDAGLVRSKFATIPIPNESVTLNGPSLVTEAKGRATSFKR
jgi:hypothetical protein